MRKIGTAIAIAIIATFSFGAMASDLQGRWEGRYDCNKMADNLMILSVALSERRPLEGVLEFKLKDSREGSYTVTIRADNAGTVRVNPVKWIKRPKGVNAITFRGQVSADGKSFKGRTGCNTGEFQVALTGPAKLPADTFVAQKSTPEKQPQQIRKKPPRQTQEQWAAAVRVEMVRLVQTRDESPRAWRALENSIISRKPWGTPRATVDELLAEYDAARAELRAIFLLDELKSGPKTLADGGIGRVLYVVDTAMKAKRWPKKTVELVREAGRAKAAEVLRPELTAAAALVPYMPSTLESLVKARAALMPIETYRPSLLRAFGTVDPEGLLAPLMNRIAEIETEPSVADELRAALELARQDEDPKRATEALLLNALGPNPASLLLPLVAEARQLAALAAIIIKDRSKESDPHEPSAKDIAVSAHQRMADVNKLLAAIEEKCRRPPDPVTAALCLYPAVISVLGGLEARLVRVEKVRCVSEKPKFQFRCDFVQDIEIFTPALGPLAPDLLQVIKQFIPNGIPAELSSARFIRIGGSEWIIDWKL